MPGLAQRFKDVLEFGLVHRETGALGIYARLISDRVARVRKRTA